MWHIFINNAMDEMRAAIVLWFILITLCHCNPMISNEAGSFTEQLRSKWPFSATEKRPSGVEDTAAPPAPSFPISSMHKYINSTGTMQSAIDHYAWSKVEPKHIIDDIAVFLLGTLKDTVQFGEPVPDKVFHCTSTSDSFFTLLLNP